MSGMRKETEEKYKEICRLHREGKKKPQIEAELHCAPSTIDRALQLYGEITRRATFEDHKETIIRLYEAGATLEKMRSETGLSITTINRNLRTMGLRRGRGWKPEGSKGHTRKQIHREQAEPEEELVLFPLQYTQNNIRRAERIEIRGKKYWDVSAWFM